jgi:hypothetical protein
MSGSLMEGIMKMRFVPLLALFTLAACDLLGSGDDVQFQLLVREAADPGPDGVVFSSRTEHGRIVASGGITIACEEYGLNANVVKVSRTQLNLIVFEQQRFTGCTRTDRSYAYDAFIGPIEPATYLLNITHRHVGTGDVSVYSEHLTVR